MYGHSDFTCTGGSQADKLTHYASSTTKVPPSTRRSNRTWAYDHEKSIRTPSQSLSQSVPIHVFLETNRGRFVSRVSCDIYTVPQWSPTSTTCWPFGLDVLINFIQFYAIASLTGCKPQIYLSHRVKHNLNTYTIWTRRTWGTSWKGSSWESKALLL